MPHSNCCPNTDFIHIFKVWFAILNSNSPLFMKTWPFPIHFSLTLSDLLNSKSMKINPICGAKLNQSYTSNKKK